jgi:hypothetical protein
VKTSPGTCPGFFEKIVDGITDTVNDAVDWAKQVGKCIGNNRDTVKKTGSDKGDATFWCSFELDLVSVTFKLRCGTNHNRRRLGEPEEPEHPDVKMEVNRPRLLTLEKQVGDPNAPVSAATPRQLLFGQTISIGPTTFAVPCFSSGNSTSSSNADGSTPFHNTRSTSFSCMAGAAVAMKAEILVDPEFTFAVDVSAKTLKFSVSITLSGKVALVALASGLCNYKFETATDPLANKPTWACYGPYCIALFWQYILTVALKGEIKARVKFESHVSYTFKIDGDILLEPKDREQQVRINPTIEPKTLWNFDVSGQTSAEISGTIGPLVSILVTPGLWASLYPTMTLQGSAAGSLVFSKGNGLEQSILKDPAVQCANAEVMVPDGTTGVPDSEACFTAAVSARGAIEVFVMGLPKLDFENDNADAAGVTHAICNIVKQVENVAANVLDDVACLIDPKDGKTDGTDTLKRLATKSADATCKAFETMKEGIFVTKQQLFCKDVWKFSSSSECLQPVGCPATPCPAGRVCPKSISVELPDLISSEKWDWRMVKQGTSCQNVKHDLNEGIFVDEEYCAALVSNDIFCGSYMLYGRHGNGAWCECVLAGAMCIETPTTNKGSLYRRHYKGQSVVHAPLPFVAAAPTNGLGAADKGNSTVKVNKTDQIVEASNTTAFVGATSTTTASGNKSITSTPSPTKSSPTSQVIASRVPKMQPVPHFIIAALAVGAISHS